MAKKPTTLKLPDVPVPDIDLGLHEDRKLGEFVADTKLHITKSAFEQVYQQGIESFWQSNGATEDDALLGMRAAALMVEGSRQALVQVIIRLGIYSAILLTVCFLVKLPFSAWCLTVPVSTVVSVCVSKRSKPHDPNLQ